MTVRLAHMGDTVRVLDLLAQAHLHSPFAPYCDFSRERWRVQLLRHLESPMSLCLTCVAAEVCGVFIGQAMDHPNAPLRIGIEVVKWIDPSYRGSSWRSVLTWFEAWAREQKCTLTSLSTDDPKFIKVHSRFGYSPVETHIVKRIVS